MNKKWIVLGVTALLLLTFSVVYFTLFYKKNDSPNQNITQEVQQMQDLNDIEDISSTEEKTESAKVPLKDIKEVGFVDNSGKVSDQTLIDEIIKKSSEETTDYMKLIFSYAGTNDDYVKKLNGRMADTEEFPITKSYYPETIIDSFEEINLRSEAKDVKILAVSVADSLDGQYSVLVRGYAETDMESDQFEKGNYYVIFEDYILIEKDGVSHFDTSFRYIVKTDEFTYGLKDDGSNSVRYNGEVVYEFDLEKYNPAYKEADKLQKQYEEKIEKQMASETDADGD